MLILKQAAKSKKHFWLFCAKKLQQWEQARCHHYYLKLFFQKSQLLGVWISEKGQLLRQASCFFNVSLGLYIQIHPYLLSQLRPLKLCKYIRSFHFWVWISSAFFSEVQKSLLQCNSIKSQSYSSVAFYPVLEKKPTAIGCELLQQHSLVCLRYDSNTVGKALVNNWKKLHYLVLHIAANIRSHLRRRVKNLGGNIWCFVSYTILQIIPSNDFLTDINTEKQSVYSCMV